MNFIIICTSTSIFLIGLTGSIFHKKNIFMILISIELLILAIIINFSLFSVVIDDILGHLFVIFVLTIAAAESALGISFILLIYRLKSNIYSGSLKFKL